MAMVRFVADQVLGAVAERTSAGVRDLLNLVCQLFALATIETDLAWFLGHGRMTPGRAKRVTQAVNELCQELRPSALTLVGGFGIPEDWLDAPIAQGAEARRQAEQRASSTR